MAEKILLIDDNDFVRKSIADILRHMDYTVLEASNGSDAVAQFKAASSEIDLIILDMIMPGMDGFETYMAMRGIRPGVKAIIMSGYTRSERMADVLKLSRTWYIQKPFGYSELSKLLSEIFGEKRK